MMSNGGQPLLSLCMIVRNETKYLPECLASASGAVDEIVVVDTGSSDGTQDLARKMGALVIQSAWHDDFSRARNEALEQAHGRWILVMDADERLIGSEHGALRQLLERSTARDKAFALLVKSSFDGGKTGQSARIVRLFPNRNDVRYEWPIHEQVNLSLARAGIGVEAAPVTILHVGYADPQTNRRKQERNLGILKRQIAEGRDVTAHTHYFAGCAHLDLGQPEAALLEYQNARQRSPSPDTTGIAGAAGIKIAECLYRLRRDSEVDACFPSGPPESWHPVLLEIRAGLAHRRGQVEEARRWNERLLDLRETAYLPTVDTTSLKVAALAWLADYWKERRHMPLAVQLLKLVLTAHASGQTMTRRDLEALYRAHGQVPLG